MSAISGHVESKYWNSVSTFGALLHFQYFSCEEIVFSLDCSPAFIQNILYTEVTATCRDLSDAYIVQELYRRTEIQYPPHLHFQYHYSEEMVYFSMDSNTDLAQYILYTEVRANQKRVKRYFHCARLESKYWNSVSTFGALLHFKYHSSGNFNGFKYWFGTIYPVYRSHGEPAERNGKVSANIALRLKCFKNASRLNRFNFPTDNAIDFLFSTLPSKIE